MKKTITLFLSIALIGVAISQTLIKDKQKAISAKDTVKKSKALFLPQGIASDSLFFATDKYIPYKKNAHASYYADKFNGRKTTSGKRFDNNNIPPRTKNYLLGQKSE